MLYFGGNRSLGELDKELPFQPLPRDGLKKERTVLATLTDISEFSVLLFDSSETFVCESLLLS